MRKFTSTEKDLCKKIAEKEEKKIEDDTYVVIIHPPHYANPPQTIPYSMLHLKCQELNIPYKTEFALWQEHDCFEWLKKNGFENWTFNGGEDTYEFQIFYDCDPTEEDGEIVNYKGIQTSGDTRLEALLRAVFAVMEKKELFLL